MDLKELLKKFYDAGIMAEATLEEKYSFEQTLADNSEALQLLQTGVSTCFLEDYEDHFFEVKYKQVSCCKIAPIVNENYCPNCGKKILK